MIHHALRGCWDRTARSLDVRRFRRRTFVGRRWSFAKDAGTRTGALGQDEQANIEGISDGNATASTFIRGKLRIRTFFRLIGFGASTGIAHHELVDGILPRGRSWRRSAVKRNEPRNPDASKADDRASPPPLSDTAVALTVAILPVALLLGYLLVNKLADISHEEDCALGPSPELRSRAAMTAMGTGLRGSTLKLLDNNDSFTSGG